MDLRKHSISDAQLKVLQDMVMRQRLVYQPFIISDDLEVGAGQHFIEGAGHRQMIHWQGPDAQKHERLTTNPEFFRASNAHLRRIYESLLDFVARELGDLGSLTCAEIGCNAGYFLYGLALRGARRCLGFDIIPNEPLFQTLNEILGTRCEFRMAEWDCVNHRLQNAVLPEVDVALTSAFTVHVVDAIYHLAYICDHSRRAVFVFSTVNNDSHLSVSYGEPSKYYKALDWPVSLDNGVKLSVPLLRSCLSQAGFEDIRELAAPADLPPEWARWFGYHKAYLALRTSDKRSALSTNSRRYTLPARSTPAKGPWRKVKSLLGLRS